MRDVFNNLAARPALAPAVQAAAVAGAIIDLKGSNGIAFLLNTGAIAGSGDFGATIQESDTAVAEDFVDAPASKIQSNAPATLAANSAYRLGYIGFKRYVRLSLTKAGGTSIVAGASAVLHPLDLPAA